MRAAVAIVLVVGLILVVAELQAMRPPARDIAKSIYLGDPDYPLCNSRDPYTVAQSELAADTRVLSISAIQRVYLRLRYLGLFKVDLSFSSGHGCTDCSVNNRSTSNSMP